MSDRREQKINDVQKWHKNARGLKDTADLQTPHVPV